MPFGPDDLSGLNQAVVPCPRREGREAIFSKKAASKEAFLPLAVAAGVVSNPQRPAAIAGINMAAQNCRAALGQIIQGLADMAGKRRVRSFKTSENSGREHRKRLYYKSKMEMD